MNRGFQMTDRNRRRYPRLQGRFQVDILNMGDDLAVSSTEALVKAEAMDVSMHGLRIKTTYDVPTGSLVSVVFYFQNRESVCLCEVVWKRQIMGENVYGLFLKKWSFLDRSLDETLQALGELPA